MAHELVLLTFLQDLKNVGLRRLLGNDTDSYDRFGTSVSVSGARVAVGSPGAEDYGQSDVKTVKCIADSGFFTVTLRGQTTVPINAAIATVESFIEKLEDISSIDVLNRLNSQRLLFRHDVSVM